MFYAPYELPEDYHSVYRRHYNAKRDELIRRKAEADAERDVILEPSSKEEALSRIIRNAQFPRNG